MKKVNTYQVGIEQLDEFGLPIEHIEYWEEYDLKVALFRYEAIEIEKNKTAKYLIAENWDGEQVILFSEGYKYDD